MSECKGEAANTAPPSGLADALRRVGLVQASEEVASLRAEVTRLSSLVKKFKSTAVEIIPSSWEGFCRLGEGRECGVCGYVGRRVDSSHGESGDFGALGQGDGPACPVCVATANTPGACEAHAFDRIYDTMARLVMLAEGAS